MIFPADTECLNGCSKDGDAASHRHIKAGFRSNPELRRGGSYLIATAAAGPHWGSH